MKILKKMKIACITYRTWASDIYYKIKEVYSDEHLFLIWNTKEEYNREKLIDFNPDLILWYGWSWIVDEIFINKYESIMLHPSPLPKYRGGSPIQNQIINGEKISAVTLFKMSHELDKGDIYIQLPMSLKGSLKDILCRISDLGFSATCNVINGDYKLTPQNHKNSTYFKRKKPIDSEITIEELQTKSSEYLYNKIRMLADPYPTAYIKTLDNKKLFLKDAFLE
jgi:methionyl-tRNA formyltransferase